MRRCAGQLARGALSLARAAAVAPADGPPPAAQALMASAMRSAARYPGASQAAWQRWSHCSCSGDLSLPPPQKVLVEYAPAEVDSFIAFADAVEDEFQGIMVDGVEVEGPGVFEVRLEDGQTIYSRAAEGGAGGVALQLPAYTDLFDRLRQAGLQAAA
ncbi:round spermatid basic 1-like [Micractinium conductrix]|uniref:Round spermatid basic 1-like n=1 Tax=Micractinium conductrix TaxID=554055 RepID=A0A2P6V821_9CHLO|nr:round spermatid basic 1-like [Micractinium conductrix]|eukprot:PSC70235.1 round spermatid basic 1-like [Micractinium conductrix]